MPQRPPDYKEMAEELAKESNLLTDWELNFLESIQQWMNQGRNLSVRQFEVLEKMKKTYKNRHFVIFHK